MSNIIFLDLDGPMIPTRCFYMEGQTEGTPTKFDPCAVGLLNKLAEEANAKIVLHSHWRKSYFHREAFPDFRVKLIEEGVKAEYLHADFECPRRLTSDRWHDIGMWLEDHEDEVTNFVILEDLPIPLGLSYYEPHTVKIDFDEGFTWNRYAEARKILKLPEVGLVLI